MAAKPSKKGQRPATSLPTKAEVLAFLKEADTKTGKRELARAFNIKGEDRKYLKEMIRDLTEDGLLARGEGKSVRPAGTLPSVAVIDIVDQDTDGELIGRPANWKEETQPPKVYLAPGEGSGRGSVPALGVGDRVLARLRPGEEVPYEARVIKKLGQSAHRILGAFEVTRQGGEVKPVDRKARGVLTIPKGQTLGAKSGDLVMAELLSQRAYGPRHARIVDKLGNMKDSRSVSLIAVHAHGIPTEFPPAVIEEAERAAQPDLKGREDMRDLPLITIDPADARDHDDAVHARPDPDPKNDGGWIVTVAIADVAHYVTPGSALDREARKRGNSTYLPDRVVPMLPEALSADLCSLREGESRACLAVEMIFTRTGRKKGHRFLRGLMRSAASLTYEMAQGAIDGRVEGKARPLMDDVLVPLWSAYHAVAEARDQRQPLDLDLPEHRIELDDQGKVRAVVQRERLDAHRLIEEFMIQANVAAAETLERRRTPLIYRVHDIPDPEKLNALNEVLDGIGLKIAKGGGVRPGHFNKVLTRVKGTEHEEFVNEVILRSQSQAVYSPENLGHFGLNLRRYAHFTSPIRRYADLVVHRALIRAMKAGKDGLSDPEIEELSDIAEHISRTERRSMAAERESVDRFMAAYLEDRVGAQFNGRISGVTRFGLFVKLEGTGADGLIPVSSLGNEYFFHDETRHALVGERSGETFRLGDPVEVRLLEAAPVSGGLRFELLSEGSRDPEALKAAKSARRRKPDRGTQKGRKNGKSGKGRKGRG